MNITNKYLESNDLLSSNPFPDISNPTENILIDNSNTKYNSTFNSSLKTITEKYHTFIVYSHHRNFKFESLFQFKIKLNPANSSKVKVPIYENNPTLTQTSHQKKLGIYGYYNPNYNPYIPKGQIVGYEYIIFSGERGCKIFRNYKNITKFNMTSIQIPKKLINYYNNSIQSVNISIPEISGFHQIYTTAGGEENITFNLDYQNDSPTSYIYINKKYISFPIPTNQLNNLSLDMSIPFVNFNDTIDILYFSKCEISSTQSNIMTVYVNDLIDTELLSVNDNILFEDIYIKSYYIDNDTSSTQTIIDTDDYYSTQTNKIFHNEQQFKILEIFTDNLNNTSYFTIELLDSFIFLNNDTDLSFLPSETIFISSSNTQKVTPKIINLSLQIKMNFDLCTTDDI